LAAKIDGPIVWPKFGFEFQADNDDILDALEEIYAVEHSGATALPTLARDYIGLSLPSRPSVGMEAIRMVQKRLVCAASSEFAEMPMQLALDDSATLTWLRARGLL
jgi:hypothetical protein